MPKPLMNTVSIKTICPQLHNIFEEFGADDSMIEQNQNDFKQLLASEEKETLKFEYVKTGLSFILYPNPSIDSKELVQVNEKE
jgi:hypothetical protein